MLESGGVFLQELAADSGFRYGLASDGVARHAVPQVYGVGEGVLFCVGVAKKRLEKIELAVVEVGFVTLRQFMDVLGFHWDNGGSSGHVGDVRRASESVVRPVRLCSPVLFHS